MPFLATLGAVVLLWKPLGERDDLVIAGTMYLLTAVGVTVGFHHTDEKGDPHSPHIGHDGGTRGVLAGLWHAHTGWLMSTQGRADWQRYPPDLYEDPGMRRISRGAHLTQAPGRTRNLNRGGVQVVRLG